jgi:hypothetical protein
MAARGPIRTGDEADQVVRDVEDLDICSLLFGGEDANRRKLDVAWPGVGRCLQRRVVEQGLAMD